MLSFFKSNSDSIVKLFVNQIGMTIFGHLLFAATFQTDIRFATGALSAIFYLYLVYSTGWELGARDKIKIDGGRMVKSPFKGVYLGLAANTINILLSLVTIICYYLRFWTWAGGTSATAYMISTLLNGMYASFYTLVKTLPYNYFSLAAFILPAILVSGISYTAGVNNFKLTVVLGLNKNTKK